MKVTDLLQNRHPKGKNVYGNCKYCLHEVERILKCAINHGLTCEKCLRNVQDDFRRCKAEHNNNKGQKTVFINSRSSASLYTNSNIDDDDDEAMSVSASQRQSSICSSSSSRPGRPGTVMEKWIDLMNANDVEPLDLLVAKFFYRTGIPFNTADCDEWKAMWNFV